LEIGQVNIQTLAKKKTVSDGGFVFCFGFSCFSNFHPSTILFGSQNLSCFCALSFSLMCKEYNSFGNSLGAQALQKKGES
jgi:hypothetical protein